MFGLSALRTTARTIAERRRRAETNRILAGLPAEIRKDIGWPATARLESAFNDPQSRPRV